jgi:hypothetical protein
VRIEVYPANPDPDIPVIPIFFDDIGRLETYTEGGWHVHGDDLLTTGKTLVLCLANIIAYVVVGESERHPN